MIRTIARRPACSALSSPTNSDSDKQTQPTKQSHAAFSSRSIIMTPLRSAWTVRTVGHINHKAQEKATSKMIHIRWDNHLGCQAANGKPRPGRGKLYNYGDKRMTGARVVGRASDVLSCAGGRAGDTAVLA